MQTLENLPKARLITRCKQGLLYVASVSQVWCLHAVEISKQREMLLKDKQFQLALTLTVNVFNYILYYYQFINIAVDLIEYYQTNKPRYWYITPDYKVHT